MERTNTLQCHTASQRTYEVATGSLICTSRTDFLPIKDDHTLSFHRLSQIQPTVGLLSKQFGNDNQTAYFILNVTSHFASMFQCKYVFNAVILDYN